MIDTENRPVLSGLAALVAVALALGVLGGVALLVVSNVVGLGGGDDSSSASGAGSQETLYLPEPTPTETTAPETTEPEPTATSTAPATPADELTLASGQTSVSSMGQIDLTGTYTQGEGAVLRVQRLEDGEWVDFPVTVSVKSQKFATYVMTGRAGPNKFRVIDTSSGRTSNEVEVTVG